MPRWKVMACTDEEYARADADPTYSPKEHQVSVIAAEDEQTALACLRRRIKAGDYPPGSQIVEDDEV